MNNGKTIFSQIMSNIPEREFKACVDRYKGNYRSRNFTCKDQFLVMSYAQLTNRGSLRDIENCLTALSSRLYHCGISYAVPRNILAKANEKRDWRIYADFAQVLVKKVRPLYAKDDFRLDLDNMEYEALTISELYRERWNVELFFKWIKQHLHIKSFYGTSENAIYLQIWIAVCTYLLLALTKKKMHMNQSLHTISKNVGLFLTDKTPINELFNKTVPEKESTDYYMPSLFGPEDF